MQCPESSRSDDTIKASPSVLHPLTSASDGSGSVSGVMR